MKNRKLKRLTVHAMIAALYTVISLVFALTSFGALQIRVSEMLTLLPALGPYCIISVTFGCFLSNLVGFLIGANPFAIDILVGTVATLIAACLTYLLRNIKVKNIPILAPLPPVLVNAIIIGGEICYMETQSFALQPFLMNAISVGVGQIIPCYVLGLLLVMYLQKTKLFEDIF